MHDHLDRDVVPTLRSQQRLHLLRVRARVRARAWARARARVRVRLGLGSGSGSGYTLHSTVQTAIRDMQCRCLRSHRRVEGPLQTRLLVRH